MPASAKLGERENYNHCINRRGFMVRFAAALVAAATIPAAFAQTPAKLVEAAKKEGALTFYTSIAEKDGLVIAADFEKRYGIKVNIWRASSVKVLQRLTAE